MVNGTDELTLNYQNPNGSAELITITMTAAEHLHMKLLERIARAIERIR